MNLLSLIILTDDHLTYLAAAGAAILLAAAIEIHRLRDRVTGLEAERDALRRQVEGHCERIARQSELLSRRAEKTGPPPLPK